MATMKYKPILFTGSFDKTLWIVRKDADNYIIQNSKPVESAINSENPEIRDKYKDYLKYNNISQYKYHGFAGITSGINYADEHSIDPKRYPFLYSNGVQYILTNDGIVLFKTGSNYYIFDVFDVENSSSETERLMLESLPNNDSFINENSIKLLNDDCDTVIAESSNENNYIGFYSRYRNYIPVYKSPGDDNTQIEYHRIKQFKIGSNIYYQSYLDELDELDTTHGSVFYKSADKNFIETDFMFRKYPKDYYIIYTDANIDNLTIKVRKKTSQSDDNGAEYTQITKENQNIIKNKDNNSIIVKLLLNNNISKTDRDDIVRIGFRFYTADNISYIKII